MRTALFASMVTLSSLAAAQATPPPLQLPRHCTKPGADRVVQRDHSAKPQKLAELPPASAIAAVWRFDERGCPSPVVLKRGIGANPEKAVEPEGSGALFEAR